MGEGKVARQRERKGLEEYLGCNTGAGIRVVDRLWEEKLVLEID